MGFFDAHGNDVSAKLFWATEMDEFAVFRIAGKNTGILFAWAIDKNGISLTNHGIGMGNDALLHHFDQAVEAFVLGRVIHIVLGLNKLFKFLPKSLDSLKATLIVPVLGTLCIGLTMYLVNTPLIYVNIGFTNMLNWLASNNLTILLCALLGAMMATDMGGPINKAAYVFAVGSLSTASAGNPSGYIIMAAVMAGGMVPPLGIAISANLFPQKYTKQQRRDAYVNYVMGGAFITEGAIPFAASDPWRVILSSVAGSALAGLLTGLFGCQLLAPHGGVFVLATIQPSGWTILLYLLAIIAGSFVSALLLGMLKRNAENPELGKWKGINFPWTK